VVTALAIIPGLMLRKKIWVNKAEKTLKE
jgi:hypothetical protein